MLSQRIDLPIAIEQAWEHARNSLASLAKIEDANPDSMDLIGTARYGFNRVHIHISLHPGETSEVSVLRIDAGDRDPRGVASQIVVEKLKRKLYNAPPQAMLPSSPGEPPPAAPTTATGPPVPNPEVPTQALLGPLPSVQPQISTVHRPEPVVSGTPTPEETVAPRKRPASAPKLRRPSTSFRQLAAVLVILAAMTGVAFAVTTAISNGSATLAAGTYAGAAQVSASSFEALSFPATKARGAFASSFTGTANWSISVNRSQQATGRFELQGPLNTMNTEPGVNCTQKSQLSWVGTISGVANGAVAAVTLRGPETTSVLASTCPNALVSGPRDYSEQFRLPLGRMTALHTYRTAMSTAITSLFAGRNAANVTGTVTRGTVAFTLTTYPNRLASSARSASSPGPASNTGSASGPGGGSGSGLLKAGTYSGTMSASGSTSETIPIPSGGETVTTSISAAGPWSITVSSTEQVSGNFQLQGPMTIRTAAQSINCTDAAQFGWSGTITGTVQEASAVVTLQGPGTISGFSPTCNGQSLSVPGGANVGVPGTTSIKVSLPLGQMTAGEPYSANVFDLPLSSQTAGFPVTGAVKGTLTFTLGPSPTASSQPPNMTGNAGTSLKIPVGTYHGHAYFVAGYSGSPTEETIMRGLYLAQGDVTLTVTKEPDVPGRPLPVYDMSLSIELVGGLSHPGLPPEYSSCVVPVPNDLTIRGTADTTDSIVQGIGSQAFDADLGGYVIGYPQISCPSYDANGAPVYSNVPGYATASFFGDAKIDPNHIDGNTFKFGSPDQRDGDGVLTITFPK